MVAIIKLKENDDFEKLDYDKALWVKWTNAAYKNTRVLALTRCNHDRNFVAGVSYDDSNQHFIQWRVNFNSVG